MIVALAAPGSSEKGSAGGARTLLVQTGCRTEIPRVRGDNTAVVHFDARAWPEAALRTALEECGGPIKTLHPVKPAGGKHVISGLSSVAVEFKDAQSAEKLRRARVVSRTKTTQSVRGWWRSHTDPIRCCKPNVALTVMNGGVVRRMGKETSSDSALQCERAPSRSRQPHGPVRR